MILRIRAFKSKEFEKSDLSIKTSDSLQGGLRFTRKIIEDRSNNSHKILYTEHFGSAGAQFSIEFGDRIVVTINKLISNQAYSMLI